MKYKRIGVTAKSDLDDRDAVVARVLAILKKQDVEVCFDAKRKRNLPSASRLPTFTCEEDFDLLLVIGGDGTILRAIRELQDFSIPILSINRGMVGFLAELTINEAPKLLPRFLRGEGVMDERSLLRVVVERRGRTIVDSYVLNEVVVSQGSIARLMDLKATVNGEDLATFRADGLIIATPTGSTAYSLAAGGPVVHPKLRATIITPINSHAFTQKPIIIPGEQTVEVEVLSKKNKFGDTQVSLTLDGQTYVTLQRHDRIRVMLNHTTVKFLRRGEETFYGALRTKLKWGELPAE